jgi:TonB family protein
MGKTAFLNLQYLKSAIMTVITFGFLAHSAFAQVPAAPAAPALPKDPKQLMLLAAQSNGLVGPDLKPWHLHATFKATDESGNTIDQGTFEELWASRTKFRRTLTGIGYSQTDYGTEHGLMRSGDQQLPPNQVATSVRTEFVEPLPEPSALQNLSFDLKELGANGNKLSCLSVAPTSIFPAYLNGQVFCLDVNKPFIRIDVISSTMTQAVHTRVLTFQGRFLAGDLQFFKATKLVLTAHLESIDLLDPVDDAIFTPTPDAKFVPRYINIAGVAAGMLKEKTAPIYPPDAKAAGVSGTVVLQSTIGTDGRVRDLKVISGPPELQKAALEAVSTWVYRPYLFNGQPVEVNTVVNVIFMLGHP